MVTTSIQGRRGIAASILLAFALLLALLAALSAVTAPVEAQSSILYVDVTANGAADGSSWADAYSDLQGALSVAQSGDEIWVATGVYTPGASRSDTFNIPSGVALYGGFGGGETGREQRDWDANPTVLSGDIGGDDVTDARGVTTDSAGITGDNAYHVVMLDGTTIPITADTRLDGVIITAGQATGGLSFDKRGGGLHCNGSGAGSECSPRLSNVAFAGNWGSYEGGAMYNNGRASGNSSPTLTNVTFTGNSVGLVGGAMFNNGSTNGYSNPTLIDVTLTGNTARVYGGAIVNDGRYSGESSPTLTNVAFVGNSAGDKGGAMFNNGYQGQSNPRLTNITFAGNSAGLSGGAIFNEGQEGESSPALINVTFTENSADEDGGAIFNNGIVGGQSSPTLTNVTFTGNSVEDDGGAMFNNRQSSPTLTNVTFAGNWAASSGGAIYNYGDGGVSSPTLTNVTFTGNRADWHGGAMYNHGNDGVSSPTLTNVTFSGNSARADGGAMYNYGYQGESSPTLTNVILWDNKAGSSGDAWHNNGATPTVAHSLIQGGWVGTGNLNADPLFVSPVNPGDAPTTAGDLRLSPGSPAIDAGDDSALPAGVTTDLAGNLRTQGAAVDMGAYEFQTSDVSLVKTVTPAAAAPGQTITYTLSYRNSGPSLAGGVLITDVLPGEVTGVTYQATGPVITETGSTPYTWQVQDLEPGAGGVITMTGTLNESLATTGVITNTATISALNDITPANNSSSAALFVGDGTVREYEMSLAVPDHCSQFSSSHEFTMSTLGIMQFRKPPAPRFIDHGDGTASFTEIVYRDDIEFEATFYFTRTTSVPDSAPATHLSPSCYVENGGSIDPSTWAYYQISATLVGTPGSEYDGAIITAKDRWIQVGEGANGRNVNLGLYTQFLWEVQQQGSTPLIRTGIGSMLLDLDGILQEDALSIAKTVSDATPDEGETITYTVAVTNTDIFAADHVTVTDSLSGTLAGDITLEAGEVVTYTYPWTADDGPQTVENVARVESAQTNPVTSTVKVEVQNVAPTLAAGPDQTVLLGSTVTVSATISDPGTDSHTATVDWDDGGGPEAASVDGSNASASHTYASVGTYIVTLCADDGDDQGCDTLTVTVIDPGLNITPTGGLITTESGGTDNFTASLTEQPASTVTVTLTSSDPTEGTVSPTTLTFDAGNWQTPQKVTVAGVDDDIDDGDLAYVIEFIVSSDDPFYSGIAAEDVSVTNLDDDGVGITVDPASGLTTTEAGGADTFSVVLQSEPSGTVTVALTSDDPTEGIVTPDSLTFDESDWQTPQAVTVTGLDDNVLDGDVVYTIETAVSSDDPSYDGIAVTDVAVTNLDDEEPPAPPSDYPAYLPLLVGSPPGLPDVVVDELSVSGDQVTVVVANVGEGPVAESFWVDVYIDPDPVPTAPNQTWPLLAEEGVVWAITDDALPLQPGQTLTLTVGDGHFDASRSNFSGTIAPGTAVYAQVDSANTASDYGGVLETDEAQDGPYNNIAGPVTPSATVRLELTVPERIAEGENESALPPRPE